MANKYYIKSALDGSAPDGLVFDIKTPVKPGAQLQAFTKRPESNQQWTFEPASSSGYFHIIGDDSLVVDIQPPVKSGSQLKALSQDKANQQWTVVDGPADKPNYFFIQSAVDNLVIAILDGAIPSSGHGTPLDAHDKLSGHDSQLWTLESAPGNSFNSKITSFTPDIDLHTPVKSTVTVAGTGFHPGAALVFQSGLITEAGLTEPEPIHGVSDFAGNFLMPATMIAWGLAIADGIDIVNQLGTFAVAVSYNSGPVVASASAQWNGIVFSDFSIPS
jgi:hypothetical protein